MLAYALEIARRRDALMPSILLTSNFAPNLDDHIFGVMSRQKFGGIYHPLNALTSPLITHKMIT